MHPIGNTYKAFEFFASHFLPRPIDYEQLTATTGQVTKAEDNEMSFQQTDVLKQPLNNDISKIILPSTDGLSILEVNNVICCEAQTNYTLFHLINQ